MLRFCGCFLKTFHAMFALSQSELTNFGMKTCLNVVYWCSLLMSGKRVKIDESILSSR